MLSMFAQVVNVWSKIIHRSHEILLAKILYCCKYL